MCYMDAMPKLWSDTVLAHRESVRNATLDAVAALVARSGLASLTMSDIAQTTGIGRATLYKYFPDVQAVLQAWHQREVSGHLRLFSSLAGGAGLPMDRLRQILTIHARNLSRHSGELVQMLHGSGHVAHAWHHLTASLSAVIREGVTEGEIREDVEPDDLANYCLSAVSGAFHVRSQAQVDQLVAVTLSALGRPTMVST